MWLRSPDPEATRAAARRLAAALGPHGAVVVLAGPLGAGKTVFAKGLAEGLGLDPDAVTSPTFGVAAEYPLAGGRRFAHVDCYRLANAAELEAAGFLDLLGDDTVVAVEWGDRFPEALPRERIEIHLQRPEPGGSQRLLNAIASGPDAAEALSRWQAALEGDAVAGLTIEPSQP